MKQYGKVNGRYKHGCKKTKLYAMWCNMKARCQNPNNKDFRYYGLRGISVYQEWKDDFTAFSRFAQSHGYNEGLSIDRIDNDGNYEPANCRFVPWIVQERNKTDRKLSYPLAMSISIRILCGEPRSSIIDQYSISSSTLWKITSGKIYSGAMDEAIRIVNDDKFYGTRV